MAKRFTHELAAFMAGALVIVAMVSWWAPAQGASSNCGVLGNWHQGRKFDVGTELDGVQANVEVRKPALCPSSNTFSLQSPMLYRDNLHGWAQIGTWHWSLLNVPFRFMWQFKREQGTTTITGTWGQPDPGTIYNFKVTRMASDGHIHMLYLNPDQTPPPNNDGFAPETNFDPRDWWDHQLAEAFSEVTHPGNDMAGTEGNKASFAVLQVRSLNGGWRGVNSWANMDNDFPCFFHIDTVTPLETFRTWTEPILHGVVCPPGG